MGPERLPSLAVVVPAWNAASQLPVSLPPLLADAGGAPVIVVDAGSTDETARVARELGAELLSLPRREGPAGARNAGSNGREEEVLLFVDADCVVEPGVVRRVREAFGQDPGLVSLTGSYDDQPADRGFFSLYMNLRHFAIHQVAKQENATFWAGLGAVRRAAFEKAKGFDALRYPRPMIEDIDLARRLRPQGRMRLDPDLRVKHLKRWTLASVVRTDIVARAIPWTEIIIEQGKTPDDLNLKTEQRLAAALAPFVLLAVGSLPVCLWLAPRAAGAALAVFFLGLWLSRAVTGVFWRKGGPLFALPAFLFHQVHLLYSALTFVWVKLSRSKPKAAGREVKT